MINLNALPVRTIEDIEKEIQNNAVLFAQSCEKNDNIELMLYEHNISLLNQILFNNKTSISILEKLCLNDGYSMEINDGLIIGIYRNNSYKNM